MEIPMDIKGKYTMPIHVVWLVIRSHCCFIIVKFITNALLFYAMFAIDVISIPSTICLSEINILNTKKDNILINTKKCFPYLV